MAIKTIKCVCCGRVNEFQRGYKSVTHLSECEVSERLKKRGYPHINNNDDTITFTVRGGNQ